MTNATRALTLLAATLIAVLFTSPIHSEDAPVSRLPTLPDPSDPYLKEMFAKIHAKGGQPLNIHLVQGFAPALAKARLDMAYALRYDVITPPLIREMAILRTGQFSIPTTSSNSTFHWRRHADDGGANRSVAGLTGEQSVR